MRALVDLDVAGKRVLVRADLDVSVKNSKLEIRNSKQELQEQVTRLVNLKPTVDWLLEHGAKQIIIAGHINRPEKSDPALSTKQLLEPLQKILDTKIVFIPDLSSYFKPGLKQVDKPGLSEVFLLENLRFWLGETANDGEFAKQLASLADVYVNEAFGNCHRNHASMVAVPLLFPDVEDPEGHRPRRAAGLHLQKEVKVLSDVLENPKHPFVAIVGGVKIETKVPVIENLAKVADSVLVGGEIARNVDRLGLVFWRKAALGSQLSESSLSVGQSVSQVKDNKPGLKSSSKPGLEDNGKVIVATLTEGGKDISNESIYQFKEVIASAKTIVWNGPMGVFEEGFDRGTHEIAKAIIESGAYAVVGGGETSQFLEKAGLLSKFSFVSAGGGAMLTFLAGKELPGLVALE